MSTQPEVENMNNKYYEIYYTVSKSRGEKGIVDNQYENDYNNFSDTISTQYVGRKTDQEILRKRNLRFWVNHFK